MNVKKSDFRNNAIDEKSCKSIFMYLIRRKILCTTKRLFISFYKNGCIKDYIGSKYLILISADGEGKGLLTKYNKCLIQLSLLLRKKG